MMLPEIARASRSKRWRKSGSGGEVLGENLHSYGTIETAVAGTVDPAHPAPSQRGLNFVGA